MLTINNILIGRDFSSVSDRALRHSLDLAARTEATLHILHADVLHDLKKRSDKSPSPGEGIDSLRQEMKQAGTLSAEAVDSVSVVEVVQRDVSPAPALLRYAANESIDLIILGTHGRRGPSRILLGSVAEEVVRRAQLPVLTVRGEDERTSTVPTPPQNRILVPIDFSDYSREALKHAHEWASLYDAQVDVLHVVEEDLHPAFYLGGVQSIYDVEPDLNEKVRAKMNTFIMEVLGATSSIETHVKSGSVSSGIIEFAEEHAVDLTILSTHGRTGLKRFLLGSVTENVVRHVHCPVLTVKAFGQSLVSNNPINDRSSAE